MPMTDAEETATRKLVPVQVFSTGSKTSGTTIKHGRKNSAGIYPITAACFSAVTNNWQRNKLNTVV